MFVIYLVAMTNETSVDLDVDMVVLQTVHGIRQLWHDDKPENATERRTVSYCGLRRVDSGSHLFGRRR